MKRFPLNRQQREIRKSPQRGHRAQRAERRLDAPGLLYQFQGMKPDKDLDTIDRIIKLYERAIKMFRKMPRLNKRGIGKRIC